MVERNGTDNIEEINTNEKEIVTDEDGVIIDLTEIRKQKRALIEVYNELDRLTESELDEKLSEIKEKISKHIEVLEAIEKRRNERFSEKRENEIKEHQRVSNSHFVNNKPVVEKKANDPRLPWVEIVKLFATLGILIVLIAITLMLI